MTYTFGVFEFDAVSLELRRSGRLVALEPQPARVLGLLLVRAGEVVTRDELTAHVWGDETHVDFNRGLAYCIGSIRAALGDSADGARYVQTLPKRGYRFVAPVALTHAEEHSAESKKRRAESKEKSEEGPRVHSWRWVMACSGVLLLALGVTPLLNAIQRSSRPVVAVSIFDNETGDPGYDRPVHAMADTVVDRLTALGVERVGVVGNEAVLRIPRNDRDLEKIKERTGASHVVLAQLQPRQGELSLLMHLIRLDDGTHLWTRRIQRPAGDPLTGLDDDAANLIESGIREQLLTPNP